MIKAVATYPDGTRLLVIGLSFKNLDKFRDKPGNTFIQINGKETGGLPMDVIIFSGETEAHLASMMEEFINEDTIVHTDPSLKS